MRAGVVSAVVAASVLTPALPAAAESARMHLDCNGTVGVIERANGASWWGVGDGAVYTTKYLQVVEDGGTFEKSYGHAASSHVACTAEHVVGDYASTWTVHLVRTR